MVKGPVRRLRGYWVLLERVEEGRPWGVQFGSHDKGDVEIERIMLREGGTRGGNLKILKVASARQADIDEAVRVLNAS